MYHPGPPLSPEELCLNYGIFDPYMSDASAWTLFLTSMILHFPILWISSYAYYQLEGYRRRLIRYQRRVDLSSRCLSSREDPFSGFTDEKLKKTFRRFALTRFCVIAVCQSIADSLSVITVLSALHLQYCERELYLFLFWSFWPLVSVGSTIAQFGTCIQTFNLLRNAGADPQLPWATALGTPVLVSTTLGFPVMDWASGRITRKPDDSELEAYIDRTYGSPLLSLSTTMCSCGSASSQRTVNTTEKKGTWSEDTAGK